MEQATLSISTHFKKEEGENEKVLVFYDVGYHHAISELEERLKKSINNNNIVFTRVEKVVKANPNINNNNNNNCNNSSSCCTRMPTQDNTATDINDDDEEEEDNNNNEENNNNNNNGENKKCCGGGQCTVEVKESDKKEEAIITSNDNDETINPDTIKMNGRYFELLPGSTLQDYTFLCIIIIIVIIVLLIMYYFLFDENRHWRG